MGKADLHIHSIHSFDGSCTIEAILAQAQKNFLNVIAISDHDTFRAHPISQSLQNKYHVEAIPAMEITTSEGHLLALFIREPVESGRPLIESIMRVHMQNGICIIPHPLAMGITSVNNPSLKRALQIPEVRETLLGLEVINGGLLHRNHEAELLAEQYHLSHIGSSDAHIRQAIGRAVSYFNGTTVEDLKRALISRTTTAAWMQPEGGIDYYMDHLKQRVLRRMGWVTHTSQYNQVGFSLQRMQNLHTN